RALTAQPRQRSRAPAADRAVALPTSEASLPERLRALQGVVGNQAIGGLLGASGARGSSSSVLGTLARNGSSFDPALRAVMGHRLGTGTGAVPVSVSLTSPPRPMCKLKVNAPGDRFEQEADRIADRVIGMPE